MGYSLDDVLKQQLGQQGAYGFPAAPAPTPAPIGGAGAGALSAPPAPAPTPAPTAASPNLLAAFPSLQAPAAAPSPTPAPLGMGGAAAAAPDPDDDSNQCNPFAKPFCGDNATAKCDGGQWVCEDSGPASLTCPSGEHPVYKIGGPQGGECVKDEGSGPGPYAAPPVPGPPRTGSAQPFSYSPGTNAFAALIEKMLRDAMAAPSRFTPEALQALYGQITRQASGQVTRGERGVRSNAAQRGMSRAGSTEAALRGVREGAESQRGQAVVGVQMAKINADYQDKMGALDRAQRYLDSLRDSEYRLIVTSEQRRQFDANLALSYANLEEQRTRLQMMLQSEWDKLQASFGFQIFQGGV